MSFGFIKFIQNKICLCCLFILLWKSLNTYLEKNPINPLYPYALSKYQGEQLCFHWNKVYRLPVNSIRIFNAYGTRSRTTGAYGAVFGVFLKQLLSKKPLTIVGDGKQKRDFLYVTDVADAFYKASQTKKSANMEFRFRKTKISK